MNQGKQNEQQAGERGKGYRHPCTSLSSSSSTSWRMIYMQAGGRCRGGFYRPLLSFQSPCSTCVRRRTRHVHDERFGHLRGNSEIRELGFALARHYFVYEHGNTARQRRKSVHGRTGQYLPVSPRLYRATLQDFSNGASFMRPADPLCPGTMTNR